MGTRARGAVFRPIYTELKRRAAPVRLNILHTGGHRRLGTGHLVDPAIAVVIEAILERLLGARMDGHVLGCAVGVVAYGTLRHIARPDGLSRVAIAVGVPIRIPGDLIHGIGVDDAVAVVVDAVADLFSLRIHRSTGVITVLVFGKSIVVRIDWLRGFERCSSVRFGGWILGGPAGLKQPQSKGTETHGDEEAMAEL